ncbi:hypothetical protein [Deinococcus frigens]|uniref:hypothetical protein n=1 Tax=Deinococcus frigens TaxID=249403 RepID=UPI000AB56073|nr:hypothetical protein [Deinococcus frigens]
MATTTGRAVNLDSEMRRVTLRAVAAVLFGAALPEADLRVVERELPPLLTHTAQRLRSVLD